MISVVSVAKTTARPFEPVYAKQTQFKNTQNKHNILYYKGLSQINSQRYLRKQTQFKPNLRAFLNWKTKKTQSPTTGVFNVKISTQGYFAEHPVAAASFGQPAAAFGQVDGSLSQQGLSQPSPHAFTASPPSAYADAWITSSPDVAVAEPESQPTTKANPTNITKSAAKITMRFILIPPENNKFLYTGLNKLANLL
jgi:hypothetical protein